MFCRSEASSSVYTTTFITNMLQEEGGTLFDARSASLGHTLQGGIPSPMDRVRGVRLSLKCMAFLEQHHAVLQKQPAHKSRHASASSAAVITMQGNSVIMVPVRDMVEHADMDNRRGKVAWWHGVKELEEELVGRSQFISLRRGESRGLARGKL